MHLPQFPHPWHVAALVLLLPACQTSAPPTEATPAADLPSLIDNVTAQCRAIGGSPVATVDASAASVLCTRPDGVAETWTISTTGR